MQTNRELNVEGVGLEVERLPRPIDWAALYGNANPVELEIGSGKGTFITDQAKARKDTNFFGIEWANFFYRYTADRLRRNGCTNARAIRAEAVFFLREFVPPGSLSVLHIYFPDPWPKARHQKRRSISDASMPMFWQVLKPGGRLSIVTDHKGYWEENIEPAVMGAVAKGLFRLDDYRPPATSAEGEVVGTNFERKYRREGRPFYPIAAVKV